MGHTTKWNLPTCLTGGGKKTRLKKGDENDIF
jgi:hypothetical protein